jgi:hypothetical protein
MKRINPGLLWAGFLVLAGVFLLLENLGVFGPWGEAVLGGLFVLGGLIFLGWFLRDRQHRWEAIAGTTLVASGAVILLEWRGIALGEWALGFVLLGLALGFWLIALFRRAEDWWAVLPAGVLTLQGLLVALGGGLDPQVFSAVFLIGLGAVFALLHLWRLKEGGARWALIPAVALALLGLVWLLGVDEASPAWLQWWPIVLIVLGLASGFLSYTRRGIFPSEKPLPPLIDSGGAAAPGTSLVEPLPEAPVGNTDIYDLIKNQPKG